ncbi:probable methyltransferase-like protein 15 homolog [Culicoides brevitarsis]|uniref:probable methyltransferase-like protein 15 homolog n=1 Tax=Culicoides brevitarsis TaxID=469753 RepID=UPI00307C44CD
MSVGLCSKIVRRFLYNAVPINKIACAQNEAHVPVMSKEVLEYLKPEDGQTIIDMTFGAGGHSKLILERAPNVKLITLDRDPLGYAYANELREKYPNNVIPLLGKFSELPALLGTNNIRQNTIDGILFDFGCSSMQFDTASRGFALSKNGPLDMRMDQNRCSDQVTAADVVNKAGENDLYRIFKVYGEEKQARKIARAIVETRHAFKRIETTKELADIVFACFDSAYKLDKIQRHSHPATKVFQALRIFVNDELNEINYGMIIAQRLLKIGGRMVTLTFHSLEDTIVKRHISGNISNDMANKIPLKFCSYQLTHDKAALDQIMESKWEQLHQHVITPKFEEIENNPRCRSAKLRAAIKTSN